LVEVLGDETLDQESRPRLDAFRWVEAESAGLANLEALEGRESCSPVLQQGYGSGLDQRLTATFASMIYVTPKQKIFKV